jgi:hypothetical protein
VPQCRPILLALLLLLVPACSGADGEASRSTPIAGSRPTSTATLAIVSPANGTIVHATTVPVRLSLEGAKIVKVTSTDLRPDRGHVHLYLDGKLISMNYSLVNRIPDVSPGHHLLQAEFVATDHAPFDPRVIAVSSFEVKP